MSDGHTAAQEDTEILSTFQTLERLEEKFITDSKFGDRVDEEIRDQAKKIIGIWDGYMGRRGLQFSSQDYYAAFHVYALGSWLEGNMDFSRTWAYLNNRTHGDLSNENVAKVATFREQYRLNGHSSS